jgi:hypothetical protein
MLSGSSLRLQYHKIEKKKAVNLLNGQTAKVGDYRKGVTFSDVTKTIAAN